jgi:DNA-binding NarL/FixJ family response regulator
VSDRLINLLLIDDDPIYRLGLAQLLNTTPSLGVLGEKNWSQALSQPAAVSPDLIILDLSPANFAFAASLGEIYPQVPLLLYTARLLGDMDCLNAQALGVRGYCLKGMPLEDLLIIIRRVAQGETYWTNLSNTLVKANQPQVRREHWLIQLAQAGINQINQNLGQIQGQLRQPSLSPFDWWYWKGRKRELQAAAWLVRQLVPVEIPPPEPETVVEMQEVALEYPSLNLVGELPRLSQARPLGTALVFERILAKLSNNLFNNTAFPLEIDILKTPRKKELLYIVFEQVRSQLDELRFLEINSQELLARKRQIAEEVWEKSSQKFLGIFYPEKNLATQGEIDRIILEEISIINQDILKKIPFVFEIFAYFLYDQKLVIDNVEYDVSAPESLNHAETLLENLIIQIANAVVSLILNNYSDTEQIKLLLYSKDFISSRQIAKFRNDLAWKYRRKKYWQEPQNIFESSYSLLRIDSSKIEQVVIYSPRQHELEKLTDWRWLVTIILETRDALSPQVRAIFSWLGQGVVYILTQVVGRGIGLIGKGIIQGVGGTWQDVRYGKNRK